MFHSYRRAGDVAVALKKCAVCGQPLPMPTDSARPIGTLCSTCSRPIKLGGVRAPVRTEGVARLG